MLWTVEMKMELSIVYHANVHLFQVTAQLAWIFEVCNTSASAFREENTVKVLHVSAFVKRLSVFSHILP